MSILAYNITNPGLHISGILTGPEQQFVTDLVLASALASEGDVLTWISGAPSWEVPSGGGYTNLTEFVDQTAWRLFYSNGSGDVTELALGADQTYLMSNGATSAPTFEAITGGGHTIEDEGTPLTQRTKLNFVGSGVAVTDDSGDDATVVTITSGGISEELAIAYAVSL